jgi:hypothetical protein
MPRRLKVRLALLTLMAAACEPNTGYELQVLAGPGLEIPPGASLKLRQETRLAPVVEVAPGELLAPPVAAMSGPADCLGSAEGCAFASYGGGWEPAPTDGVYVVRAWVDLTGDDTFNWDADAPMLDYLPDEEDPQGITLIPIRMRQLVDATLEILPPE